MGVYKLPKFSYEDWFGLLHEFRCSGLEQGDLRGISQTDTPEYSWLFESNEKKSLHSDSTREKSFQLGPFRVWPIRKDPRTLRKSGCLWTRTRSNNFRTMHHNNETPQKSQQAWWRPIACSWLWAANFHGLLRLQRCRYVRQFGLGTFCVWPSAREIDRSFPLWVVGLQMWGVQEIQNRSIFESVSPQSLVVPEIFHETPFDGQSRNPIRLPPGIDEQAFLEQACLMA